MSPEQGAHERREQMRKAFADLSTETLLAQVGKEADGFTAEALELMRQELRDRGVAPDRLAGDPGAQPGSGPARPDSGELVAVAAFGERLFAVQARELLRGRELEGWIDDRGSLGTHEFPIPDIEGKHVLLVDQTQAAAARELLAEFAPAAEVDLSGSSAAGTPAGGE